MTSKLKNLFILLRPYQWYKNLIILVPILFAKEIFNFSLYLNLFLTFIALCLASGFNYIINDIKDVEKDRLHPEKRKRPIASGKISIKEGYLFALIVLILSFWISLNINSLVFISILGLILTNFLYTFYFKKIAFADSIVLGFHYIWRVLAGAFSTNIFVSPWLLIIIYQIALFLAIAKRKGDLILLGENAINHKKILVDYVEVSDHLLSIIASSIIATYFIYVSQKDIKLFTSFPFALYLLFKYLYFVYKEPIVARELSNLFKKKGFLVSGLLFVISLFFALYL